MERRAFLRTGVAAGVYGLGGLPTLHAETLNRPHRQADGPLRLNANENPAGLSPGARRAVLEGLDEANRYPFDSERRLLETLSAKLHLEPENLILGNGSTEVLQMAVQAFGEPGTKLLYAEPTFEDVPTYARPYEFTIKTVPLDVRNAHNIDWMSDEATSLLQRIPVLVYICNPNNPTGTLTPSAEVDAWIEAAPEHVTFLVDEAYFEFVSDGRYWSSVKWIAEKRNVIVVRTFSKIYGMAGMRLGYGMAHPETAARVRQYIASNNANHLANVAAIASLQDAGLVGRSRQTNARGRRVLHDVLDALDLEYLESHTNFVMHRINGDLATYIRRMREQGVFVGRPFPPMLGFNRLAIGLPDQMERFAEILQAFRQRGWV